MFLNSKQDYQERLFDILNPLLPHYSAGYARLSLGFTGAHYSKTVEEMESFSRVLWGLGSYLSGGASNSTFEEIYLQGLTNGTNPQSAEYWGDVENSDQRIAESAAIAVALLLAREKLWEPLTQEAKDNIAAWFGSINAHTMPPNNWQFFGVLVNVALKRLGLPQFSQEALDMHLETINGCYEGNGWYRDGRLPMRDYYVAFAFHFYGLIYSVFMEEDDPVNSQNFRERAMLFGPQFVYWFDAQGSAIPYGRSLTYRFAEIAFFSACLFAGIEPVPMAVMKGIIDRNLQMWWNSHMQEFSGILSIGYKYPNLVMAERYNAPGSPLWALKAFLLLSLDDNHPYWSIEAEKYPTLEQIKAFPAGHMVISHQNGAGAVMYPEGPLVLPVVLGHMEEKYAKFAYSSKLGFSVHKANDCLENMAPDNDLVFQIGGRLFGRASITSGSINNREITSQWSPFPGIDVTSFLTVYQNGYVVRHTITSSIECTAYGGGFAVSKAEPGYTTSLPTNRAVIQTDNIMVDVSGGEGIIIDASANTNLLFPRTGIPAVSRAINVGTTTFIVGVVVSSR